MLSKQKFAQHYNNGSRTSSVAFFILLFGAILSIFLILILPKSFTFFALYAILLLIKKQKGEIYEAFIFW